MEKTNTNRHLEVIKSFLKSQFHYVNIDTEGGWETGNSCRRIFEGKVLPRAKTYSSDEKEYVKHWKSIDECREWLPDNALHKSLNLYDFDRSGKNHGYQQYVKDLDNEVRLILEINSGSISGVGYDKGWEVRLGIVYKNFIFKLYSYKVSKDHFEIDAINDLEYIRSLDMIGMTRTNDSYGDFYMATYYFNRIYQKTTSQDKADMLSLVMDEEKTITFSDEMMSNFSDIQGISSTSDCRFGRDVLKILQPKKIILQDNFDIENSFDIPESLEEIVLDFKPRKYGSKDLVEGFLDRNKKLGKYLKCSDNCEKIAARELFHKEQALFAEEVNLWFEYNELKGFVNTNKFQLNIMEEFYKKQEVVKLPIGDLTIEMTPAEFWKCIKIEKKIKNKSYLKKAIGYFGSKVGYTSWFLKEFDLYPKYKFDK